MSLRHPNELPVDLFTCDECSKRRAVVCIAERYWCHKCLCPDEYPLYVPPGASSISLMEDHAPGRYDTKRLNAALKKGPAGKKVRFARFRDGW